jgi:hypothetical protein
MGNDASNMKESSIIPQRISNVHTTEQEENLTHMNQFVEQNQINDKTEAMQDIKVEKYCH